MGWQIGLVCAKSGYNVRLHDIRTEAMESARHHQAANLDEWAAAGELDEPALKPYWIALATIQLPPKPSPALSSCSRP